MSNLKHHIPLRVDYDLPAGYRLPPPPRHTARPTRGASQRRRPRRIVVNALWLRRRSLARRAWRQRQPVIETIGGTLMLLGLIVFYGWLCWQVGGYLYTALGGLHASIR